MFFNILICYYQIYIIYTSIIDRIFEIYAVFNIRITGQILFLWRQLQKWPPQNNPAEKVFLNLNGLYATDKIFMLLSHCYLYTPRKDYIF